MADILGDMFVFDTDGMFWSNVSKPAAGNIPSPRFAHGFTELGGMLYIHGGYLDPCAEDSGLAIILKCKCFGMFGSDRFAFISVC